MYRNTIAYSSLALSFYCMEKVKMSSKIGEKHIMTDVLVIGSGMAGCFAAIKAKEHGLDVILADKGYVGKSGGTHFAEGDILAFRAERGHKIKEWIDLMWKRCEYLNNLDWLEICLKESEDRFNDLVSWGVPFYEEDGKIYINSGASGKKVSVYENISMVPRKYMPVLRKKALEGGIKVLDRIMFSELLKQDGEIVGAVGFSTTSGELFIIQAKATVLATGAASLKASSSPDHYWTADGQGMAYRAGAEIAGQEFGMGLYRGSGAAGPLRDEIKRKLQTSKGTGISGKIVDTLAHFPAMHAGTGWFSPDINAEGGPVITPAWEAHCGRAPVYVDVDTYTPEKMDWARYFLRRFGTEQFDKIGLDIFKRGKVEYTAMECLTLSVGGGSGVWPTNKNCASGLPGLFAAGNSCATMEAGAGYAGMGSGINHAAVTGNRAGLGAAEYASKLKKIKIDNAEIKKVKDSVCAPMERKGGFSPAWLTQVIQGITVPYFFLRVKHGERLQAALKLAEFYNIHLVPKLMARDAHEWRMAQEAKNMALLTEMRLRSSLFRTESRGTHYREDYPRRDDPAWLAWIKLKNEKGEMKVYKKPVPKKWWPDLSKSYEERYPSMFPGE